MISLTRSQLEANIELHKAAQAIEAAYRATSLGTVNLPPVGHITFPGNADCHIKYGHMAGDENFVIKVATGFPQNTAIGLQSGNGLVVVLSAKTGQVEAVLHDEMMLTDIRTGIGGAIASRLLAREDSKRLLVVGTGEQARWQIRCHKALLPQLKNFSVWGRNIARATKVVEDLSADLSIYLEPDLEQAVQQADIVVTATGSQQAFLAMNWVQAGTHITAVGADAPGKQELDADLIARADLLAVDLASQCLDHGEISHAAEVGRIRVDDLKEIGAILNDPDLGRTDPAQITIADLTGIAAQDIAIANAVLAEWSANNP